MKGTSSIQSAGYRKVPFPFIAYVSSENHHAQQVPLDFNLKLEARPPNRLPAPTYLRI